MKLENTPENMEIIEEVQRLVNRDVTYMTDSANYGVPENWIADVKMRIGDCEDYSLRKMLTLMQRGIPEECMGVATCFVDGDHNRGHAVLIVSTVDGDLVLDNRFKPVMMWDEIPDNYVWNYIPPNVKD